MRSGRLLVEDSPTNLLQTYDCNLLEQVTLKLCRADEARAKDLQHNQPFPGASQVRIKSSLKKRIWEQFLSAQIL